MKHMVIIFSVFGDIDFGEILSCILNAQAECSDEQPDMSAAQMETAVQSMKYMCTDGKYICTC